MPVVIACFSIICERPSRRGAAVPLFPGASSRASPSPVKRGTAQVPRRGIADPGPPFRFSRTLHLRDRSFREGLGSHRRMTERTALPSIRPGPRITFDHRRRIVRKKVGAAYTIDRVEGWMQQHSASRRHPPLCLSGTFFSTRRAAFSACAAVMQRRGTEFHRAVFSPVNIFIGLQTVHERAMAPVRRCHEVQGGIGRHLLA